MHPLKLLGEIVDRLLGGGAADFGAAARAQALGDLRAQLDLLFRVGLFQRLRIGVGLSWLAIVAAEMLTGGVGIGFFIWDAWNSSRLPDIIVALVYIGVVGFVLDKLVAALGKVITRGAAAN